MICGGEPGATPPTHQAMTRRASSEPECTCERLDVDLYDARGCLRCDPRFAEPQVAVELIEALDDVTGELLPFVHPEISDYCPF